MIRDAAGDYGFLEDGAAFSLIDVPGSTRTIACGINNADQIAGVFDDAARMQHSFLATPVPEPDALGLLAMGLAGLLGQQAIRRRRGPAP